MNANATPHVTPKYFACALEHESQRIDRAEGRLAERQRELERARRLLAKAESWVDPSAGGRERYDVTMAREDVALCEKLLAEALPALEAVKAESARILAELRAGLPEQDPAVAESAAALDAARAREAELATDLVATNAAQSEATTVAELARLRAEAHELDLESVVACNLTRAAAQAHATAIAAVERERREAEAEAREVRRQHFRDLAEAFVHAEHDRQVALRRLEAVDRVSPSSVESAALAIRSALRTGREVGPDLLAELAAQIRGDSFGASRGQR